MSVVFRRTARQSSLAQIRYVSPVRPGAASDLVARVYAEVERDFGMLAPPVALHAPAPGPLAACWLMLRETLLATNVVSRGIKEAVGTAVSLGNTCPYCVEVHGATLGGLIRSGFAPDGDLVADDDADALASGRFEAIADPGVRAIATWARACGRRDAAARHEPPFQAEQAAELIGVVVTFHYLNRMVNVFLRESPFPPSLPTAVRGRLMRLLTRILGPTTRTTRPPGGSLGLLPDAPAPENLSWAAGAPHVAGAFARAAAAIDAAADHTVPQSVRDLVTTRLAAWTGEPPGLSRAWAEDAVSEVPAADRAAGRLALLTALASYQVDASVIADFRRTRPGDRSLIELTSWASFATARRVGDWTWDSPAYVRAADSGRKEPSR